MRVVAAAEQNPPTADAVPLFGKGGLGGFLCRKHYRIIYLQKFDDLNQHNLFRTFL